MHKTSGVSIIQEEASDELLALLADSIPAFRADTAKAYHAYDLVHLGRLIHKMHGGACYTNTPRLLATIKALDDALQKNNIMQISELYQMMLLALDTFETAYAQRKQH